LSTTIEANYTETYLFPPSLEDFVSSDDPARFIRAFVDSLDAKVLGIKERNSETGRPEYSWRLLLRVWLYGWFEHIHSTRQLEKLCYRDVGMMWLTGLHRPDHNTIWRFYNDNKCALRAVFKQSTRVAMANDLVGMVLHAVDGTKIRADASRYKDLSKKRLERSLHDLDGAIDEALSMIEHCEQEDISQEHLPDHLQDDQKLREKIRSDLALFSSSDRPNINTTDPESRLMHTREGTQRYCYNAQAVADERSGIIVSADVTRDEIDRHQLTNQLDHVNDMTGGQADCTVADAGYFSGEELSRAEDRGDVVAVAIPDRYNENQFVKTGDTHHVNNYAYDESEDCFVCPRGGRLIFRGKHGKDTMLYECEHFNSCKHRDECTSSKQRKRITVSKYHSIIRRHRELQRNSTIIREALCRRSRLIEPIFGGIKHHLGFRRFRGRGYINARAQWFMVCCIHNLKKLYRYRGIAVHFT
jgi:transposase